MVDPLGDLTDAEMQEMQDRIDEAVEAVPPNRVTMAELIKVSRDAQFSFLEELSNRRIRDTQRSSIMPDIGRRKQ